MYPKSRFLNPDPGLTLRCGIQLTLMFHHLIDYNYLFYYALLNGHDGIIQSYVVRRSTNVVRRSMHLQLLSGRQLSDKLKGDTVVQVAMLNQ